MHIHYVDTHNLAQLQQQAPAVAMALGYFDGVHIGHQHVIQAAKKQAVTRGVQLAVLSFFPHPKSVLQPDKPMQYIEPLAQKARKLEQLGVDHFYVVQFTKALAALSPTAFVDDYVKGLHAVEVVCGFDYTYGHQASGTADTLAVYAATQHIGCTIVGEHTHNAQKVSSTRIRHCVQNGQLRVLPELLGRYYTTEYCQTTGVLPYYTLPKQGHYHILLDTGDAFIPCMATVQCTQRVQLHCDVRELPQRVHIQWIDHAHNMQVYA